MAPAEDPRGAPVLRIEVVYATPQQQDLVAVSLPAPLTAGQAVQASGLLQRHPEIELETATLGVFGEVVAHQHMLVEGDRVEIYRPLRIDPRAARRQLARQRRTMSDRLDED
jgi:putative ubiquitin-RnfH superfamily antitoxin RatB of RatAB toxin-antitoxin module